MVRHDPGQWLRSLPARIAAGAELPWIPSDLPAQSFKPLRLLADDRGFVELLRMPPGAVMPLHRHSGECHAYHLGGSRQLSSGEIVGPGDYLYQPPGHIGWWKVVGDEAMTALMMVFGAVEFLGPGGNVRGRTDAASRRDAYRRHCAVQGWTVLDLDERAHGEPRERP